ncbi:MAG: hypothetical protein AABZ11_07570 [Nitrospinota bacterium]
MNDLILIKDLPHALFDDVIKDLAQYTIAFLRVQNVAQSQQVDLLGSGVLVSVGKTRAILTAHHVVHVLPRTRRLGLLLGRTDQPHTIDTQGTAFLKIARGTQDSLGPDLGAVVLAQQIANSIASIKTFYNLDERRDQLLHSPPDLRDGFWTAQGFLEEGTVITPDPDGRCMTKSFYNFSGIGGPEAVDQIGEYDYFEFPVSHEARQTAPRSWGGMSGGGLWQIPLKRQGSGLLPLTPLLSGILFYQQPTTATECGVRGHGRRSVYEQAYKYIQSCEP